jgi:transglutaminase-like putative cysteine protease
VLLIASAAVAPTAVRGLPLLLGVFATVFGVTVARRAALLESAMSAHEGCCSRHPARGQPTRLMTAAACVFVALIGWLLIPPAQAGGLHGRFGHSGIGSSGAAHAFSSAKPSTLSAFSAAQLDLRTRGRLSDEPLLQVADDSPLLWRGAVYATYDGTTWRRLRPSFQMVGGIGTADHLVARDTVDPQPVGEVRTDDAAAYIPPFNGVVMTPGVPINIVTRTDVFADGTGTLLEKTPSAYRVTSIVPTTDPKVLARATDADDVNRGWTALPAIPARIRELARSITAHSHDRHAKVVAIESWLRTNAKYKLDSPVPKPGEDAVDDFLFRDRVGFCEQFASAETVLLRTLNVPARLVTGLADGSKTPTPGKRLFRASDAHAWVEVYYPGVGWSPSDPTAGAALATSGTSWDAKLRAAWGWLINHLGGRAGVAVVLLVIFGATVHFASVWRRRARRTPGREKPAVIGPVLSAFNVLEAKLAATDPPIARRAQAESVREYLARAGLAAQLAGALDVLELECYGSRPPAYAQQETAANAFLQSAAAIATTATALTYASSSL